MHCFTFLLWSTRSLPLQNRRPLAEVLAVRTRAWRLNYPLLAKSGNAGRHRHSEEPHTLRRTWGHHLQKLRIILMYCEFTSGECAHGDTHRDAHTHTHTHSLIPTLTITLHREVFKFPFLFPFSLLSPSFLTPFSLRFVSRSFHYMLQIVTTHQSVTTHQIILRHERVTIRQSNNTP